MGEKRYMISDASRMLGIESHVLRYWEEELDIVIPRNEMGHRYYTDYHINLLRNIRKLKQQGYGLRAIKMMLADPNEAAEEKNTGNLPGVRVHFEAENRLDAADSPMNAKLEQFQNIMDGIVSKAIQNSTKNLGKELSDDVSQNVLKGVNYMMRLQDEKEDARYKKLDELMRSRQRESRKERKQRQKAEKVLAKDVKKTKAAAEKKAKNEVLKKGTGESCFIFDYYH